MKLVPSVLIKSLLPRVWASGLWWDVEWCEVMCEQGIKVLRDPESHKVVPFSVFFQSFCLRQGKSPPFIVLSRSLMTLTLTVLSLNQRRRA